MASSPLERHRDGSTCTAAVLRTDNDADLDVIEKQLSEHKLLKLFHQHDALAAASRVFIGFFPYSFPISCFGRLTKN